VRILAISGSLRGGSSNTTLLRAAAMLAPDGVSVELYEGLGDLPHFNPDLDREGDAPPASVAEFRDRVAIADALLICSPEYAHGVPGTLKNALDWLVSSPAIIGKPVALLNASFRATYAHASLTETLTVMSARVVADASITVPLDGRKGLDAAGIVGDEELAGLLRKALGDLASST
jgi:chromate reductase, NAD(P)H dehydrogenase (quinone)